VKVPYPPLRIHVWGGLGSQLFAAALAFDYRTKFPKRSLKVVFHTSGVTKRNPECVQLFPEFHFELVDDFSNKDASISSIAGKSRFINFKKIMKLCGFACGLLAEENTRESRSAKVWTLSVRGHYSHRKLDPEFIRVLAERFDLNSKFEKYVPISNVILHYRLGDLLHLDEKNPVSADRIYSVLTKYSEIHEFSILSDSPHLAFARFEHFESDTVIRPINASTIDAIAIGVNADLFVGTSSKISYWIIILRAFMGKNGLSCIPIEDLPNLERHVAVSSCLRTY
jgi:hypothetical protein